MIVRYQRYGDGTCSLLCSTSLGRGGAKFWDSQLFNTEFDDFGLDSEFVYSLEKGRANLSLQVSQTYSQRGGVSNE